MSSHDYQARPCIYYNLFTFSAHIQSQDHLKTFIDTNIFKDIHNKSDIEFYQVEVILTQRNNTDMSEFVQFYQTHTIIIT